MSDAALPWYRRTLRWGQTNLTETDPERYDPELWRAQWKATRIQGVIVNAGGIVAYYPSAFPLQHRASHLGDRDLYGEIVAHARADGLSVIARMDSNRAGEEFYAAHPDWFSCDADGAPYRAGAAYISCVNSPYYDEYLPAVFREIIERSAPDGFADNSWAGLASHQICYCTYCRTRFRDAVGEALPARRDWDDPVFREWVRWNDRRRVEIWRQNTAVTTEAGGPDCVWVGMLHGDLADQVKRFTDLRELTRDAKILFVDHQRRTQRDGFAENAEVGKRLHQLAGWDVLMPESQAMYAAGAGFFRSTSMPEAEVRVWSASGTAGGIQPWWHHISAYHEDRRQYATAEPIFTFHERNERYLTDRTPRAQVAVVWSQANSYFHGRDDVDNTAVAPNRGMVAALRRARIPYLPVHADDIAGLSEEIGVLVLPDLAVMSAEQCEAVRAFAARGGSVVATGQTSLKDADGQLLDDFGLADVLGVSATGSSRGTVQPYAFDIEDWQRHDYLRFDDAVADESSPLRSGLEGTTILALGGRLEGVRAVDADVAATYVEPFPFYPPELAWLRTEPTSTPVLTVRAHPAGGRIAYLAADLDRAASRDHRPDSLQLLGNVVRWTHPAPPLLEVDGAGDIDCHVYEQDSALVVHLVTNTAPSPVPGSLHELIPLGPFRVQVRDPRLTGEIRGRALVADTDLTVSTDAGTATVEVPKLLDHEIVVLGLPG
ncbi:Tat pathway signal protein [Desertihabitans brevis]|uniref:Tat pathway signal protein n=1 Tax=Desertihabitans brevis TaxID=2268447 RepID=A0A367YWR4_9ACTN|nr:Tat pathway signal protein [Desertihabitans brevis]RCK70177.1 Tat pathway signal protein [Desertihabitans brevis]